MVAARSSADHVLVSTDPDILADVAEIALHWMDLASYGSAESREALLGPVPCTGCEPGLWTVTATGFDRLPVS